jgi:uncharacterized protein (UPF0335 family)
MTNANIKQFAEELSDVLIKAEDLKVEAAAIIQAAKEAGINVKALRKVAKELTMQADKLAAKYEEEDQLSLFRDQVGIHQRKGLVQHAEAA